MLPAEFVYPPWASTHEYRKMMKQGGIRYRATITEYYMGLLSLNLLLEEREAVVLRVTSSDSYDLMYKYMGVMWMMPNQQALLDADNTMEVTVTFQSCKGCPFCLRGHAYRWFCYHQKAREERSFNERFVFDSFKWGNNILVCPEWPIPVWCPIQLESYTTIIGEGLKNIERLKHED